MAQVFSPDAVQLLRNIQQIRCQLSQMADQNASPAGWACANSLPRPPTARPNLNGG
jgi:hypothetical protein